MSGRPISPLERWNGVLEGFDEQPEPNDPRAPAPSQNEAMANQFVRFLNGYHARQPDPDDLEERLERIVRHSRGPVTKLFSCFELHRVPELEVASEEPWR